MRVRKAAALAAVLALMLALASCGETVGSYRVLDTLAEQQFSIGYRSGDNVQPYVEAAIRELAADGTIHSLALKWFAGTTPPSPRAPARWRAWARPRRARCSSAWTRTPSP